VITATTATNEIDEVLGRLSRTTLKHSLMLDLCLAAYWDGELDPAEQDELLDFGAKLGLEPEQVKAVLALAKDFAKDQDHAASLKAAVSSGIPKEGLAMAAALADENVLA
jgi:hypothetical protein